MGLLRVRHDWATSLSCIGEGNGNPLQYSCLENLRNRGAGWATISGDAQSQTRLTLLSSSSSSMYTGGTHVIKFLCFIPLICLLLYSNFSQELGAVKGTLFFLLHRIQFIFLEFKWKYSWHFFSCYKYHSPHEWRGHFCLKINEITQFDISMLFFFFNFNS